MKTILNKINIRSLLAFCFVILLSTACSKEDNDSLEEDLERSFFYLSVRTSTYGINEDDVLWEDRVDELRMILFNPANGSVVFNQKLYFPNGFDNRSQGVSISPGTYNIYFIANESAFTGELTSALESMTNQSEFTTDNRFLNIAYNPDFRPDGNSSNGRFLMSAVYNDISVQNGGTQANPALLNVPTGKIDLVRSLAKVEVIFRKKVAGSTVLDNTITSVQLLNVASQISVPPLDDYYAGQRTNSAQAVLTGLDYSRDSIGAVSFYIPEFLIQEGNTNNTLIHINNESFPILTDAQMTGIVQQRRTVPALSTNSVVRNYHYKVNVYVEGQTGFEIRIFIQPWNKVGYIYEIKEEVVPG